MRRNRRFPIGALALAVVLIGPAAARAQLFPDMTIKRQRPCCAAEDPRYRIVREQYFGYYPTCWRRFPPGWGCPSPEAPNWEASLRELPLQQPPGAGEGPGPGEGEFDPFTMQGQRRNGELAPGEQPNLPPLPEDRDPFRMDDLQPPAGAAPAPGTEPRGRLAPVPVPEMEPALPDLDNPQTPPPAGGAEDLRLPRAGASLTPQPADLGLAPAAPASDESTAPEGPSADVSAAPATPALETSGALASAAPEISPELAPPGSPRISTPELNGLSDDLLPAAPPLGPPAVGAASVPVSLPPSVQPGPITAGPRPGLEPIPDDPAGHQNPPRRGILTRIFGRTHQR